MVLYTTLGDYECFIDWMYFILENGHSLHSDAACACLYSDAFALCMSYIIIIMIEVSKHYKSGLLPNLCIENILRHPCVAFKFVNPQTFHVAGKSHTIQASIALTVIKHSSDKRTLTP